MDANGEEDLPQRTQRAQRDGGEDCHLPSPGFGTARRRHRSHKREGIAKNLRGTAKLWGIVVRMWVGSLGGQPPRGPGFQPGAGARRAHGRSPEKSFALAELGAMADLAQGTGWKHRATSGPPPRSGGFHPTPLPPVPESSSAIPQGTRSHAGSARSRGRPGRGRQGERQRERARIRPNGRGPSSPLATTADRAWNGPAWEEEEPWSPPSSIQAPGHAPSLS